MSPNRRRFCIQALLWMAWVLLSLLALSQNKPPDSRMVALLSALALMIWLASELLRAIVLARGWLDGRPLRLVLQMLWLAPVLSVAMQLLMHGVMHAARLLGWLPAEGAQGGIQLTHVLNVTVLLWVWAGIWTGAQYLQRWRDGEVARWKAEADRRALELQVMRAQVNPHFVFNALNNLRALINENPQEAREMVSRLSNILRHVLVHSARERVPLREELAMVRDYVALEQIHQGERLQVHWHIDDSLFDVPLPPMLLQLLVENAIKHGVARMPGGGHVGIAVERVGEAMMLRVENPGHFAQATKPAAAGPDTVKDGSTGIGLAHVRQQLQHAGAQLNVSEEAGRVVVHVLWPFTLKPLASA